MKGVRGPSAGPAIVERPTWRGPRVGVVLLVLSALFFGVNFAQEWWNIRQVLQSAAQLQQQIAAQNAQNAQLKAQLAYYSSKAYVVPAARALGWSRRGDTVMMPAFQPARTRIVKVYVQAPPADNFIVRLLHTIL